MPQEIPIEASETLAFTPDSLKQLDAPPVFTLRAATWREKNAIRKITNRLSFEYHSPEAQRTVTRDGLKKHWGPEKCEQYMPRIEAWWDATDAHATATKTDPAAEIEFDVEEAETVGLLLDRIRKAHLPLAEMLADNSEFIQMRYPVLVSVVVTGWTGLETKLEREDGFLSLDCVMAMVEELDSLSTKSGLAFSEVPFLQLGAACHDRLYLSEEEAKNSASPLLSETPPEVSSNGADHGLSPESTEPTASPKPSKKTPPSA